MKISFAVVAMVAGGVMLGACQAPANEDFDSTFGDNVIVAGNGSNYGLVVTGGVPAAMGSVQGGTVPGAIGTGTASYTGLYEVVHYLAGDDEFSTDAGYVTLAADFGAGTLAGSDGDLTIAANISGLTLDGEASYDGIDGTLNGVIGADRATAYFGGVNGNSGFAGAFLVSP